MGENQKERAKWMPGKKSLLLMGLIILCLSVALISVTLIKGDKAVKFKMLSENKIPREIANQIIPEYRTLERALACVAGDKIYVVVTRGEKPTSGYKVGIDKMKLQEKDGKTTLIVYANFQDPEKKTPLAQVLTYPCQVAETGLAKLPNDIELRIQYQ